MRRLPHIVVAVVLVGVLGLWVLSRPQLLEQEDYTGLVGNVENGGYVFWAAGCASCHAKPDATGEDKLVLSGGYRIDSPFGTFIAPNISPGPNGINGWTTYDLANALVAGVSPNGDHIYPSLPYTTYTRMRPQDVADLKVFIDTLPVSDSPSQPHEVSFPFTIRRALGIWKRINLRRGWVMSDPPTPELLRGRYLVEALGHCAECHTPRNIIGGLDMGKWMQGAPNPSGKGNIPAISPDKLDWSVGDIAYYLETGFTPDFDSAGGQMAKVISATAKLTPSDRNAIAAYLRTPLGAVSHQ